MQLTPTIVLHMGAAIGATVTGPVALWARLGREKRPRLHRAFGYTWVVLMVVTALSALFIRDSSLPNLSGYTPIHLLVPFTLFGLVGAFHALARGNIRAHRQRMQQLYIGACLVAGAFTLVPGRYLGDLLWGSLFHLPLPHVLESTMLFQLLTHHPEALGTILRNTPSWVWGLFAGLLALGASQLRGRTMSALRVALVPVGMAGFSAWGMAGAFSASPVLTEVLAVWVAVAAVVTGVMLTGTAHASYDATTRTFHVPGSVMPLLMIVGIFLVKWSVGVELAMVPQHVQQASFVVPVAAVYGVFNGLFAGRAARLWKLTLAPAAVRAAA